MIYLCTSNHKEAKPFIKAFNLKKDTRCHKFEVFISPQILLIITGNGKVKSAVLATYLYAIYPPGNADYCVHVGECHSLNNSSLPIDIYLCSKILDMDTKDTYYPDLLFKHPFQEITVKTYSDDKDINIKLDATLYDNEASAFYESALQFFQSHQIFVLKILCRLDGDYYNEIENKYKEIAQWIVNIQTAFVYNEDIITKEELESLNKLAINMKWTWNMIQQLEHLLIFYKHEKGDILQVINTFSNISCKSKNEGKIIFEQFKERLI